MPVPSLHTQAMSVLATHHDGSVQYNAHQLYGISSASTVAEAVGQVLGKRPFVLSRSSFLGSGAYAAHWTGDNSGGQVDGRERVMQAGT